ncbi:T7SS effector LXG polymorphic toxin [Peribacillus sp. NPDC097284]|uniref:T7SS effector LXG polymorphic toxin n=1 Tax=Peribacillus sp. NPDC097284 TaxID=3364401 RepID=UPI0038022023
MTIFEAKPLKSAVKSRAKQYEDLLGQVETLKKEFQGIVDLDEELAGAGATAIKNFYRAQVEVANAWIELFTTQISFLKGIPAILEDADLSGETVVEVPFLEGEVTHGLSNAKSMVNQQSTDLQKIFQNIDDILSLQVFDQGDFHEKMEKAEKEKNDTIKKVHEVDNKLVEEYQVTEAQESVAISLFQALLEATSQDGTVSPMNFNQSAFQASQAYQVKDEVAENMQGYRDFKKQEEEARKLEQEMEELENRPWYEKAWDTTKTFTGEITGYYDSVRATTGVDPVTGRKLSEAERIAAGAMAAAGFIPIVGWAGRAVKGGSAVYKTVKGLNAADHALDAYKSSKGLDVLKQTEYGLYGLTAANGLGEAVTGKDMFGNELTDEQRQNSLMNALGIAGVAGAAKVADKMASGTKFIPYSKEFVQNQVQKAQGTIKDMGKALGKVEVPTGVKVRTVADTTGNTYKSIDVDKMPIKDLAQKITAKSEGSKGAGNIGKITEIKEKDLGKQIIKGKNGRKELAPNVRYVTEDGYKYTTDEIGRIVDVEAEGLILQKGTRNPGMQVAAGREDRLMDDDGGHLIGTQFHGSGDIDNLVAQNRQINRSGGEWYKMENEWATALKEIPPKKVSVKIEPIYSGESLRPSYFEILYEIEGKGIFEKTIRNSAGS